jgi:hypothetical protein
MTVKIKAWDLGRNTPHHVEATGATLPHAVRNAVKLLGLGPGRTLCKTRHVSGVWLWDWSGHILEVHVLTGRKNKSFACT